MGLLEDYEEYAKEKIENNEYISGDEDLKTQPFITLSSEYPNYRSKYFKGMVKKCQNEDGTLRTEDLCQWGCVSNKLSDIMMNMD